VSTVKKEARRGGRKKGEREGSIYILITNHMGVTSQLKVYLGIYLQMKTTISLLDISHRNSGIY